MASQFSKYTGGIAPVQGLYEMGAQIGKNYAAGITAVSQNITKGIEDYNKVKSESAYADSEFDAEGAKYTALADMLNSEPETAHLVEGITPILETIAKGRKGSHSAKMASLSQVKAQGQALAQTFNIMNLVQTAKVNRTFNEAGALPPEGEETLTKSFGVNPQDTKWSPNLGYNDNVNRVRGNYRKWLETHKDEIASGKFRVISEEDFIKDWKKKLPASIEGSDLAPQDKAWAMDILENNNLLEGIDIDNDPSMEGLRGQASYFQDWATINPYRGSGTINPDAAPAGTIAQQPAARSANPYGHPNAIKLRDENEKLLAESKRLTARIGTGWFGGNDSVDKPRVKEIAKQMKANSLIIESLGGASSSSEINKAEAGRSKVQVPRIVFNENEEEAAPEPVIVPDKVEEPMAPAPVQRVAPAPAPVQRVAPAPAPVVTKRKDEPSVDENGVLTEKGATDLLNSASKALGVPFQDLDDVYKVTPEASRGMAYIDWLNGVSSGKIRYKEVYKTETPAAPAPMAPAKVAETPAAPAPMAPAKVAEAPAAPAPMAPPKVQATEPYAPRPLTDEEINPTVRTADKAPAASAASAKATAKDGESTVYPFPPETGGKYTVKKGMSLMTIAQRAGTTRKMIMKANGINANHDFKGGETIIIPPSVAKNREQDRDPESIEPLFEEGQISEEEAAGGLPPVGDVTVDPETGNMVWNKEIKGNIPKVDEEVEGEEDEGINVEAFAPIKLRPVGVRKPAEQPLLPTGVKKAYTQAEQDDLEIAALNVQESHNEIDSQNRSVKPAIEYLQRIKQNVLRGDATSVDFGTYGAWQKMHPDAATAISVGTQAAALWIGGGWSKTLGEANKLTKANFASKRISYARELAEAAFDSQSLKLGRELTDSEIGALTAKAFNKAGLAKHPLGAEDAMKIGKAVGKSSAKSAFWETLALAMVGAEDSGWNAPDSASDNDIRGHLRETLAEIRTVRHTNGGYNQWVPFGLGDEVITSGEKAGIVEILDKRIAGLNKVYADNEVQKQYLKANATPQNLLKLANALRADAKAKLTAVEMAKASGLYEDPSGIPDEGYDDLEVGAQPIASKDFVIPQSNESRKKQMSEYMKGRLGYVPAGFDDMWRKQYPESTLQIKETPYGVFFSDKTGEWKQMATTKGNQMEPKDVAANKAVQFGNLQPDGTYEPTEFVKGSGIKLGGIGSFGTASEASKFRIEYLRKIKALRYASELKDINETLFRSMMPSLWGKSSAKVSYLVAQMRQELIGVGSVSDFEQKLLQDLVSNPTDFFRLQSTVRAKYEELVDRLSKSLVEDPQALGLDVQMPKDKQAQLKNFRALYLAQTERNKAKMAEFQKQDKTVYKYSQQYDDPK